MATTAIMTITVTMAASRIMVSPTTASPIITVGTITTASTATRASTVMATIPVTAPATRRRA